MSTDDPWMTAADAASLLQVNRATLYAYVSRGYVRSQSMAGSSRERQYARDDVDRLRRRTEERRDPDKAAAHALQWGMPILESSIALIDGQTLYYRGHDAVTLARTRSIQEVASLIWTGGFDATFAPPGTVTAEKTERDLPFVARAQSMLAVASARDSLAFDLRPEGVAATGWRILHLLTQTATGAAATPTHRVAAPAKGRALLTSTPAASVPAPSVDQMLAQAWGVPARGVELLRAALILCADHELNVSSFTARCVASAGSNPYAVAIAGLAALEGTRHGGISARVESMLTALRTDRDARGDQSPRSGRTSRGRGAREVSTVRGAHSGRSVRAAIGERLRRGERIDGFGHPLYRDRDPRAAALFDLLRARYASSTELAFVLDVGDAASVVLREAPTVDFALAALARVLRLPAGAPLTLFAIGRTIGWIGHALEQYATGQLIRPRAKYVGVAIRETEGRS